MTMEQRRVPRHMLSELGFGVRNEDGVLHGSAPVIPQMHAPGTKHLRTSILAVWTDLLSGLLAAQAMDGRVPVTLELDIHLFHPAPGSGTVRAVGTPVKRGRTVFVSSVAFSTDD